MNSELHRLNIESQAIAIIKGAKSLFSSSYQNGAYQDDMIVADGGTLAFRSHIDTPLTANNLGVVRIKFSGQGVVRQTGIAPVGAVYNDGGWNDSVGIQPIVSGDTWIGSRGDISGGLDFAPFGNVNYTITKVGRGVIRVYFPNFNNQTPNQRLVIAEGVLRIRHNGVSPLTFAGGTLEVPVNFARTFGTGSSQIQWTGDGGFSAYGAARTVTIGTAQTPPQLTWGQQYFVGDGHALLLSSRYANNIITFTNNINLGSSASDLREVRVERAQSNNAYGVLSGVLNGRAGLRKTGPGLLHLNNNTTLNNGYKGETVIEDGALRGVSSVSNIVIAGGVLALDADFIRSIGTGGDQIRWAGSGGFAAFGANRTVKFGNSANTVIWGGQSWGGGTPHFISDEAELRFGHYLADATVLWGSKLAFNDNIDASYSIYLERGKNASIPTVVFNEALSGYAEVLTIRGDGRMDLTQANPDLGLTELRLRGAELRLSDNGTIDYLEHINISNGGTLTIKNTATHTLSNRLGGQVEILSLDSGRIAFDSVFLGEALHHEKLANRMFLTGGANRINSASREMSIFPVIHELVRNGTSRSTLTFESPPGNIPHLLLLGEDPSDYLVGGIFPWATLRSTDFVTVGSDSFGVDGVNYMLGPYGGEGVEYNTGPQNTWTHTSNVKTESSDTTLQLTGTPSVNSLILNQNLSISAGD